MGDRVDGMGSQTFSHVVEGEDGDVGTALLVVGAGSGSRRYRCESEVEVSLLVNEIRKLAWASIVEGPNPEDRHPDLPPVSVYMAEALRLAARPMVRDVVIVTGIDGRQVRCLAMTGSPGGYQVESLPDNAQGIGHPDSRLHRVGTEPEGVALVEILFRIHAGSSRKVTHPSRKPATPCQGREPDPSSDRLGRPACPRA